MKALRKRNENLVFPPVSFSTEPEGLRGRILKAFSAHLFGYGVRLANRLVLPPLFLRAWGAEAYGDWLGLTSLLFFFSLSDLGGRYYLNNHLTLKILAREHRNFSRAFTSAALLTTVVALVAGAVIWAWGRSGNALPFSTLVVTLLALQFFCTALEQLLTSAFRAIGLAHHGIALCNLAELTQVLLTGLLLLRGVPQDAPFALSYLLPHVLMVGIALLILKRKVRADWSSSAAEVRETFRQASPFFSTLLSEALVLQGLLTLLSWVCPPSEVAAWGTLRTMANLAFVVQTSLTLATWPELVRLMGKKAQAGSLFRIQVRASLYLSSLLLLTLGWGGPLIYHYWLGGKIAFDGNIFALMLLYTFVNGFWGTFQKFCLVTEPIPKIGKITLLASLVTVGASLLGGKLAGAWGYTAGMVLAEAAFPAWYFPWRIRKKFGEVTPELLLAGGCALLLAAAYRAPVLNYALVPLFAVLVWKEHQRLRRFAVGLLMVQLLFLSAPEARAQELFQVLQPHKNEEKNCTTLTRALRTGSSIVALAPGADFRIRCTVEIPDGRSLWIPGNTTLTLTGSVTTAIRIPGSGQILGNGSLRVLPSSGLLDEKSPRTGILLTGSEATVQMGKIEGFEYGLYLLGEDRGCAYNDVRVRKILNSLHAVKLNALGEGWVNQNYIHVSRIANSLREKNPAWPGTYGIYLDSETQHAPNTNRFSGSIENTRYGIRLVGLYNRLDGLRMELDATPTVPTVRVVVGQTTFTEKNCVGRKKGKGCIPTQDNWWFGEWGRVRDGDILLTESFKKFEGASLSSALQGFGIAGFRSLSGEKE